MSVSGRQSMGDAEGPWVVSDAGINTAAQKKTPWFAAKAFPWQSCSVLKQIPQELIVNLVVELHFRGLHDRSQKARAAVG